ncbi:Hypothetical protein D9617_12g036220 [Elsinoe fawcettii]|nr:Hypothetical protein D9617_12g036220 [Elsinoe fawcettii]
MRPQSLPVRYYSTVSLLAQTIFASNLPYNPTRIHLSNSPDGKPHAYILQPGSDSTTSAQLSSIDLSDAIDSTNPKPKSLSSTLPFVTSNKVTAYTSFVDQSGNITVLSGDCSRGADGASLWRLKPDNGAQNGGTWSQDKVVAKDLKGQDSVTGANFLNAAVAFSELVGGNATDTDLYAFGGMCPDTGASDSTWTSNAKYSNTMVTYTPQDDTKEDDDYKIALITSKGPPIAEAGMTMTPLSPTFQNTSGVQTQQQDFVVLGGHTQSAFINMSQVALFSLPQAIWSFLPVQQPGGATVPSDTNFVSPRSGHTAVLSEDGRSIVIYGGWVGDVNTPASPQIAVLQIGSGYGGTGAWKWTTISTPAGSFSGGLGIYGHGAVMLPGNVMMIMGGYTISSAAKLARRATPAVNTRTFLYNVTSNTWITSYSAPPEALAAMSGSQPASDGLQTPSQKAGVGIGVTFGVIALAGAGVLYLWHSKRSKRQRINRDSMAMQLNGEKPAWDDGWNTHTLTGGRTDYDPGYDPSSPEREAFPWLPQIGQTWKIEQSKRREVDSTGAFLNIPSPTRGLRRASGGRNYTYQATPVEEPRMSGALSGIHPIVETDEEGYASNASSRPGTADAQRRLLAAHEIFDRTSAKQRDANENPFKDPEPNPLGSHPVSPEPEAGTSSSPFRGQPPIYALNINRANAHTSMQDWASAHSHLDRSSAGNSSPTKSASDDRTLSNLSEMSSRSYQSARSIARTTSTRSQAVFGLSGAPRISPQPSPTEDRTFSFTPSTHAGLSGSLSGRRSPKRTYSSGPMHIRTDSDITRKRSVTSPARGHRQQYSFDQLRSEGETLLPPSTDLQSSMSKTRPLRPASSLYSDQDNELYYNNDGDITPTSPTRKRLNWVGSIRRALGSYNPIDLARSASASFQGPVEGSQLISSYSDRSMTPSPTKGLEAYDSGTGSLRTKPRRTASDSSAFLTLKRGKGDWDGTEGEKSAWEPYRDEPDGGDWGLPSPDEAPVLPLKSARRKTRARTGTGKSVNFVPVDGEEGEEGEKRGSAYGDLRNDVGPGGKRRRESVDEEREGSDDEWDVERAVEKRDVQVMFTVPKARLRVVNADPERASMRSVSGGSKGSGKSPVIGAERGRE